MKISNVDYCSTGHINHYHQKQFKIIKYQNVRRVGVHLSTQQENLSSQIFGPVQEHLRERVATLITQGQAHALDAFV